MNFNKIEHGKFNFSTRDLENEEKEMIIFVVTENLNINYVTFRYPKDVSPEEFLTCYLQPALFQLTQKEEKDMEEEL